MWIFTKYGFYSAVCARKNLKIEGIDESKIMIRSRSKMHLENLIERFTVLEGKIHETLNNDYRYRIFTEKETWGNVLQDIGQELDYDNFKNEVKNHSKDYDYYESLGDVWETMYKLQNNYR